MKANKFILTSTLLGLMSINGIMAQNTDAEGCKDSPMFPSRMPNYFIYECSKNFDAVTFHTNPDMSIETSKEGTKTVVRYDFNFESSQEKPSCLQILKNYENAVKKVGGKTLFFNSEQGEATFQVTNTDKDVWVKIESLGNDNTDAFILTIVEIEAMKQEIVADEIYKALNNDGFLALYLNFATGKSTLEPSSDKQVEEIAQMLKNNPNLKINIEGHTDNVGSETSNQKLSEDRAKAVMNALVANGIDKTRLSSKGWGQTKPIADNRTEDGKAKNRRVEIVKL